VLSLAKRGPGHSRAGRDVNAPDAPLRRPATAAADCFAFGGFVLAPARRSVWRRDGTSVPLTPRLFNALQLFVEHPGELLEKDRLLAALWPGLVVEENSLSQVISALRRALGDDGREKRYIQTEPRRGFRFIAELTVQRDLVPSADEAVFLDTFGQTIAADARRAAVAVLPFVSLAQDGRDDLLEVGMADSLISRLSAIPRLVVRSVGSVRRFCGMDQDAMQAGQTLDVTWIVDGSLQRRGDQLRVTSRLLSVPDGVAAWSGSFGEKITSVFDVQDAISERVADALALYLKDVTPQGAGPNRAAEGGTRDVEAYQHYLAAQQHAQGIRADGLRNSVEAFQHALAIDPNYALAQVGMAESFRRMIFGADRSPAELFEPSRRWVLQALAVAPNLAEAHCQQAWILNWYDYNWAESAREFRQALALKPNLAAAHFGLGFLLVTLGRQDEGLAHVHTACELDPMSLLYNTMYACFLAHHGDRSAGQARLNWVLEVEPRFWVAHMAVATIRMGEGDLAAAIAAATRSRELTDQSTQPSALLGLLHARCGQHDEAHAALSRLQLQAQSRYVPPTSMAAVLAALGQNAAALDQLERAFEVRDTRLIYMKDDRRWIPLRQEARYRALMQRMRLDGYGPGLLGP
jgi:DNA-binding winged helix-turn-helix (wHTH) protein/TolB-like protein/Tfp pilus assembly protein PilF